MDSAKTPGAEGDETPTWEGPHLEPIVEGDGVVGVNRPDLFR